MGKTLNWALLGTGAIAGEMAQVLAHSGRRFYAVSSRTYEKAVCFAQQYGIEKVYRDYREMLADPLIDIIYIATPHNTHIQFLRAALLCQKHVLCEKSITLNSAELEEAAELAKQNGVVLAEAMTIWHMPIYKKLWALVRTGTLGRVQMLQVNFGSFKAYDMHNRFFDPKIAGGAMLDIGVYALSLVRSFLSEQPEQVCSLMRPAPSGVDEQAGVLLMNRQGEMAGITLSLHAKQPKRAVISCEKAYIEIMEYPRADTAVIVDAATGERTQIQAGDAERALLYEVEDMEAAVQSGEPSGMQMDLSADVMALMTRLRHEWGVRYPEEL